MFSLTDQPLLPPSILAKLALGDTGLRPMGDLNTAMRDLNLDACEVRMLVDLGYLVAFNISATASRSRHAKSELRILTRSIERYRVLRSKRVCDLEWPKLFQLIVRHQKPVLLGTEVQRALNCNRGHVHNLVAKKKLRVQQRSRRGPGGSWKITRRSFEKFLKARLC